ncbi:MAG: BrnA antitoxin family protein [Acetobacteraceae bacterium]
MSEKERFSGTVVSDEGAAPSGKTDWARLDAMTDGDVAAAVRDDPDAAPLDIDWSKARVVYPQGKEVITLRLDRDVLEWFKRQGKGYQTRINAVLRSFYDANHRVRG